MTETIYLAGPEVFFPDAKEIFDGKKSLCEKYGFLGLAPLDNEVALDPENPERTAEAIFKANEKTMDLADFCVANITPFRGVSADPGTVYEIGYMRGIKKTVYGYSCTARKYSQRASQFGLISVDDTVDVDGNAIESFNLIENLMIPCGIDASGGGVITPSGNADLDISRNLDLFEKTLKLAVDNRTIVSLRAKG